LAPAFVVEQGAGGTASVEFDSLPRNPTSTPAKAGAQLGGMSNKAQPLIKAAFPFGPRPPPGWRPVLRWWFLLKC
jgi:hypothetical protein